jgi:hypothetical protein
MSVMSRRIVLDASVARGAGEKSHPFSVRCRDILLTMLAAGHRLVVTRDLQLEWEKHASRTSIRWKALMASKGRLVAVDEVADLGFEIDELEHGHCAHRIGKDLLILRAAVGADRAVVSADARLLESILCELSSMPIVGGIAWGQPSDEGELDCITWLAAGARLRSPFRIRDRALPASAK